MAQRTSQGVKDGGSALPSGTAQPALPRAEALGRRNPDQRAPSPALAKEDVLYATRPKPPAQLIRATRSREDGRTKQRIIANLGRKEVVVARGDLDRLARSVVRLAQRSMVLSLVEGEAPPNARCQRIGPALLFERVWHEVGCRAVLEELAAGRQFEFAAERAVFLTVLHRLFVSGSD